MRALIDFSIATIIALGLGMGSVWHTVGNYDALDHVRSGPWDAVIITGIRDADPYMRAILARTAATPLPATEALEFHATRDSSGAPLRGQCTYRISSKALETRWWTLWVGNDKGQLVANAANRHAVNSHSILRNGDGDFEIVLSSDARAGNWLPAPRSGSLRLALTLYDTRLYTNGGLGEMQLPTITAEACE